MNHILKATALIIFALNFSYTSATTEANCKINEETPGFSIELVTGDWSGDGHAKTEAVRICSTADRKTLLAAYKLGAKSIGLDFAEEVAADYEDSEISDKDFALLVAAGVPIDESYLELDTEKFAYIWMEIAKIGNPQVQYRVLEPSASISIGGYGLFY